MGRLWLPDGNGDDSLDINDEEGDVSEPTVQKRRHHAWRAMQTRIGDLRRVATYGPQDNRDQRLVQIAVELVIVELLSKEKGL